MRPRRFDATASSAGSGWPRRAWLDVTHSAALALIPFRPRGRAPDADGKASPAGSRSFLRRPVRIPGLVSCSGTGPSSERRGDASGRPPAPAVSGQTAQVPPTAEAPAPANVAPAAEALVHDTAERDIPVDGRRSAGCLFDSRRRPQALASEAIPGFFRPASRPGAFGADARTAETVFALRLAIRRSTQRFARLCSNRAANQTSTAARRPDLCFRLQRRIRLDGAEGVQLHAGHPYVVEVSASVTKNGAPLNSTIQWGPALGTGAVSSGMTYAPSSQPIFYRDRKVTRVGFNDIQKHQEPRRAARIRWCRRSLLPGRGAVSNRADPRAVRTSARAG